MAHRFESELRGPRFVQHVEEAKGGQRDRDQDHAGQRGSPELDRLGLQQTPVGGFRCGEQC